MQARNRNRSGAAPKRRQDRLLAIELEQLYSTRGLSCRDRGISRSGPSKIDLRPNSVAKKLLRRSWRTLPTTTVAAFVRPVQDIALTSLSTRLLAQNRCWIGLVGGTLLYALLSSSAFPQSAAEWSQMKAACSNSGGHPAADNYNDWVTGGGCVCNGSPSNQPICPGGSSPSTAGSGSDTSAMAGVISTGMRGLTSQQTLGAGIGILGAYMILKGLSGDPVQEAADQGAEAERQAALRWQQEQQQQEAERRAEASKQELLRSLKGTGVSTDLALKDSGTGASLQLKTGDASPPAPQVIHDGFSVPSFEPAPQ